MKEILIIGAGIGGLSTAIRLAAAGQSVTIYEKNAQVGGKMGQIVTDGFRWDIGPSVITMRHVFEELFAVAGRRLEDYLTLEPVDPLTRYFYPNGTILDAKEDPTQMAKQIQQIAPQDVAGYQQYLRYVEQIHRITGPVFIYDQPPTWRSFLRVPFPNWFKIDGLRTMQAAIESHVHSPELRQLLGRFATYVGGSPYLAPATLNVIAHVELSGGVWYPRGGIYAIAQAMAKLARELGVTIHTNCGVQEIVVKNGRFQHLILENGEEAKGTAVVSNLDFTTTRQNLLKNFNAKAQRRRGLIGWLTQLVSLKKPATTANKIKNSQFTIHNSLFAPSCSGFILLLGINKQFPKLAHHNILFSPDYPAEFEAIFQQGQPPADPTIYIAITSKTDPEHAPVGGENWFVLVNAPPLDGRYDWQTNQQAYRDLVLQKIAGFGFDVRDHIASEQILTPLDLAKGSGAWRGALYGASPNSRWAAFKRPHNRAKQIKGLYFAGGTTHPGGGVPMVTLSGKVAAELVLADIVP
ncbi:phytoene desaturase family protein [Candidatus Leptofilum sp.]|uniref:phytoene desaturase family protein n=1 Tax=Candidatus Leptofilum sp. TaxID=3241576 RepID=UPI003B5AB56B